MSTIAAISTPQGVGALGIIRLSGPEAIAIAHRLFPAKNLLKSAARQFYFGPLQHRNEQIDEVIIGLYHAPHSYTGEDVVEISCHGSSYILKRIMEALLVEGATLAGPGEFSMRAFANGKLDLAQAEAVAGLIAAESRAAHDVALRQMKGGLSKKLAALRSDLIHLAALLELELDFSEEDVSFASRTHLKELLENTAREIKHLIDSFALGNAIQNGVKVVIAGQPNAGKSTLLNTLVQEQRALVTDIPGTTRDIIEDSIILDGIKFRLMDTAGLRSSSDVLENMGIELTRRKIAEADIILYLFDASQMNTSALIDQLKELPPATARIIAGNKIDLIENIDFLQEKFPQANLFFSAKSEQGIETLKEALLRRLPSYNADDTIITHIRHVESLSQALAAIEQAKEGLHSGLSTELLATTLRQALYYLGTITGQISSQEVLSHIFGSFCIGK